MSCQVHNGKAEMHDIFEFAKHITVNMFLGNYFIDYFKHSDFSIKRGDGSNHSGEVPILLMTVETRNTAN